MSPYVIAPHKIIEKYKECITQLPKHLFFPFPMSLDYGFLVYRVAELSAFVQNEVIIYTVKMPLVENLVFEVFNVIPIPKLLKTNKFVTVDNKLKQVAVDEERQTYISLNLQDLDGCLEVWNKYWVCKKPFIYKYRNIYKNPVCDLQLLLGDDNHNCNKRIVVINEILLHQLEENKWLYATGKKMKIEETCKADFKAYSDLYGVGILTLEPNCQVRTPDLVIKSAGSVMISQVKSDVITTMDILNEHIDDELIAQVKSNQTKILHHFDDLRDAGETLTDIENQLQSMREERTHLVINVTGSVVFVILVLLVLLMVKYRKMCPMIFRQYNIGPEIQLEPKITAANTNGELNFEVNIPQSQAPQVYPIVY